MTMYQEVYNLKNSAVWIRFIQEASLSKDRSVGLKMENGLLFGTDRWFDAIDNDTIQKHIIYGYISKVYMSGHNDYPEFEVTDKDGIKTVWDRPMNDDRFVEGRGVEVMYVIQKYKAGGTTNCLIKVSIDTDSANPALL